MQYLLETDRLYIKPFAQDDSEVLHALFNDKDVMQYIGDGSIPALEGVSKSLSNWIKQYDDFGYSLFAIQLKDSGQIIGFCGLLRQHIDGEDQVELGYRLGKAFWHQGFATEAALKVKEYTVSELGIDELISIIQPENTQSIKVAEKVGMHHLNDTIFHDIPVSIYAFNG